MNKKTSYIPYALAKEVYERDRLCAWCGRYVEFGKRNRDWNVDHLIPITVARWVSSVYPERYNFYGLVKVLHRRGNLAIMHPKCNRTKGNYIFRLNGLHSMSNMSIGQMSRYNKIYHLLENAIVDYLNIEASVHELQKKKCYTCGEKVGKADITLRRINNEEEMKLENACTICFGCAAKYGSASMVESYKKGKMNKVHDENDGYKIEDEEGAYEEAVNK